jgi:putative tryptophan/tyrosine transport system substrate-binding protein
MKRQKCRLSGLTRTWREPGKSVAFDPKETSSSGLSMLRIGRREFITLLGGAAVWPLRARAQQPEKIPTIGYLAPTNPATLSRNTSTLLQRLRELGWVEGRTVTIETRWAEGRPERVAEIAVEFVRLKVDVIVTTSTNDSIEMKRATSVVPIVFAVSGDPVGAGLITSLARPGGNVTGLSIQQTDSAGKRIELLREIVPGLRRLAVLANPDSRNVVLELGEIQAAARSIGLDVARSEIRQAADIDSTFELLKARADAVYVVSDPLVNSNRNRIAMLALDARLPTIYGFRELVEAGG